MFNFDNSYKKLANNLYTIINPIPVTEPKMVIYNKELHQNLGIKEDIKPEYLSGNLIQKGSEPIAQAYAGHQFGQLNILGDGRAILLGEHITENGERFDIQLKGSGVTPYSRGGDGRATLYSMLREYLISYAMEKLNIPTTKSLSVVSTGDKVYRDKPLDGAILTRVASSHIRVGTFQFVAMQGDFKMLKDFTDYVINRHYPELKMEENPYISLLRTVMINQIKLIVNWLRVGFIHGVMNTDNVSICGETIDFGPCAFMDTYKPGTVFSSIDRQGRYAFDNQKNIGGWNIARFAECLIPLIDTDTQKALDLVNTVLDEYKNIFNFRYSTMMSHKIGISNPVEEDFKLTQELLDIMEENRLDYTKTFRELKDKNVPCLSNWYKKWEVRNIDYSLIENRNPEIIPRNHIVEEVLIEASENGNMKPYNDLLEALETPYSDCISSYYYNPPEVEDSNYKTFCGT